MRKLLIEVSIVRHTVLVLLIILLVHALHFLTTYVLYLLLNKL